MTNSLALCFALIFESFFSASAFYENIKGLHLWQFTKKHNLLQASKMQMVLGGWAFSF